MSESKQLAPEDISAAAQPKGKLGFAFGTRFFALLLLGLGWLVLAFFDRRFGYAMLLWDLMLCVIWAIDVSRLPTPKQMRVSRSWSGPPSLDRFTDVVLSVEMDRAVSLDVTLTDDAPVEVIPEVATRHMILVAGVGVAQYRIQPRRRGDLKFGSVYIRYRSRLRVAERWASADLHQLVRIFPNLQDTVQQSMYLMKNRQIELQQRLLRLRGQGREFESLREYRTGDDYRAVSWSATARRAKLVVRQFQVERSQTVWIVVDCGRLMRAEVGRLNKLDYACNASLSLAQVALHGGDKVGLLTYGRRPRARVAPGRGASHLRQILETLALAKGEASEADHALAAATVMATQRRRALIIWITDLADTAIIPEVISGASAVATRNLMIFAAVAQPELRIKANENPADKAALYQVTAAREVAQRRELLLARLRTQGAFTFEVDPANLGEQIITQYLEIKEKNLL